VLASSSGFGVLSIPSLSGVRIPSGHPGWMMAASLCGSSWRECDSGGSSDFTLRGKSSKCVQCGEPNIDSSACGVRQGACKSVRVLFLTLT
jgi:hypothetical protein